jgi:hypothetical protein
MPLIAIIVFALTALTLIIDQSQFMETQSQGVALQQMTAQSAKEFAEFTEAAAAYVQSVGLPLPGTALTVSDLQGANLLPSTFPSQTPFGQTLVADYVADPNNPVALDIVAHTTGAMNAALLQKAGVSMGSMATVQYDTAVVAQNQVPSAIPGSTGQFFGIENGSTLTSLGSSSSMTLPPSINTKYSEVAEYILSPGQYGYWLVGGSVYGYGAVFPVIAGVDQFRMTMYAQPSISSVGFSLTCPSVAKNLGNLSGNSPVGNNETLFFSNTSNNASQSPLFCIPAYKGQVTTFSQGALTQVINTQNYANYQFANMQWNGQNYVDPQYAGYYPGSGSNGTGRVTYVNPSSIDGLNENLSASGGFAGSAYPDNQMPGNEGFPMNLPDNISAAGVDISVKDPNNHTVNYQIEMDGGVVFTGGGCWEYLVNPSTGQYTPYDVFATGTGSNEENLCGSQETFWTDWHAVKNSSNTSSMPVSQTYEYDGNSYTMNYSVATPRVN